MVTSPSACKRWLQQLVSKQPIKLVLHLLFEFCVQPCNQTPSFENLADLGRKPIIPLLHAYNLALAGLATWCEPGSARKTTNQALKALSLTPLARNRAQEADVCALGGCSRSWRAACDADCVWERLFRCRWPAAAAEAAAASRVQVGKEGSSCFSDIYTDPVVVLTEFHPNL